MRPEEIAMQLTMKALETNYIAKRTHIAGKGSNQEEVSEDNKLIAAEIGKFYQRMLSAVRGSDDFTVQV